MVRTSPFAAWQLEILGHESFRELGAEGRLSEAQARYLLCLSLLAPSSHNSVPQAYALDLERGRIRLLLNRRHVLPGSDPTGRQALISVGCALANLELAALEYGLRVEWQPEPVLAWGAFAPASADELVPLGSLVCTGRAATGDAERGWVAAMVERIVVRAELDDRVELPRELVEGLQHGAGSLGVRLHVFEARRERFAWGKLDELALKFKLEQDDFRRELGCFMLANDDQQSERGMRGREFGLDDHVTAELGAQLRGERNLAGDQLALLARGGRMGLTSASAVCVLAVEHETPAALIDVGRAYQRCALVAWQRGFVNAVHTAICEVAHVRAIARATLLPGLEPRGSRGPCMVFRLGQPLAAVERTRPHSSRPALASLLCEGLGPSG
jgi:hypothetical protein